MSYDTCMYVYIYVCLYVCIYILRSVSQDIKRESNQDYISTVYIRSSVIIPPAFEEMFTFSKDSG